MRILLVEDDEMLGEATHTGLRQDGHAVDWVRDGEQAKSALHAVEYEAVVLDLGLPRTQGIDVLRWLRASGHRAIVIIVTARDLIADRIAGLDAGADDYLIKPFALSELVARIEAILRRSRGSRKRQLQVADLSYDLDTLYVSRAGQPLKLNPLGLKLLAILMQRSPAVVRREALEESLWGDDCPDSDSLRSHIHQLRQVLDKPFPTPLLHTIHGVGYRLAESADAV